MKARGKVAAVLLFAAMPIALAAETVAPTQPATSDFAAVRHIIAVRCRFCHTGVPQEDGLNAATKPPKDVKFDTLADWRKFGVMIKDAAVTTRRMPPDNATHITDGERAVLGAWLASGAVVPDR